MVVMAPNDHLLKKKGSLLTPSKSKIVFRINLKRIDSSKPSRQEQPTSSPVGRENSSLTTRPLVIISTLFRIEGSEAINPRNRFKSPPKKRNSKIIHPFFFYQ